MILILMIKLHHFTIPECYSVNLEVREIFTIKSGVLYRICLKQERHFIKREVRSQIAVVSFLCEILARLSGPRLVTYTSVSKTSRSYDSKSVVEKNSLRSLSLTLPPFFTGKPHNLDLVSF